MDITVNGDVRNVPEGISAAGLLELLEIPRERVVVEVNVTILKRAQHPETVLQPGDRVEIVHFVGGGN
ncbi:MAG TPA: sulfur carrier protein ThiS [bacterium]